MDERSRESRALTLQEFRASAAQLFRRGWVKVFLIAEFIATASGVFDAAGKTLLIPQWVWVLALGFGAMASPFLALLAVRVPARDGAASAADAVGLAFVDDGRRARLRQRLEQRIAAGEQLLRDLRTFVAADERGPGPLPIGLVQALERVDDWPLAISRWIEGTRGDLSRELPTIAANRFPPQPLPAALRDANPWNVPIEDIERRIDVLRAMLFDLDAD